MRKPNCGMAPRTGVGHVGIVTGHFHALDVPTVGPYLVDPGEWPGCAAFRGPCAGDDLLGPCPSSCARQPGRISLCAARDGVVIVLRIEDHVLFDLPVRVAEKSQAPRVRLVGRVQARTGDVHALEPAAAGQPFNRFRVGMCEVFVRAENKVEFVLLEIRRRIDDDHSIGALNSDRRVAPPRDPDDVLGMQSCV